MSNQRKESRYPKRTKPAKNKLDCESLEGLLPSDQKLSNREEDWIGLFMKYKKLDNESLSDVDADELSDVCDDQEQLDSSSESVASEEFVADDNPDSPDDLADLDLNAAQTQLQSCYQRRINDWSTHGFKDNQLAIQNTPSTMPGGDSSWLFQRLIPDTAMMSSFHKSSTSTMTEKKEMSSTSSKQKQVLTKTITTIVKQVMVHSSHIASATLGRNGSPLSDDVFAPSRTIVTPPNDYLSHATADDSDSELSSSSSSSSAVVQFKLPRKHVDKSRHKRYRKTPFKAPFKSCLKNSSSKLDQNTTKASNTHPRKDTTSSSGSASSMRHINAAKPKPQAVTSRQRRRHISRLDSSSSDDDVDDKTDVILKQWPTCSSNQGEAPSVSAPPKEVAEHPTQSMSNIPAKSPSVIESLTTRMDEFNIKSAEKKSRDTPLLENVPTKVIIKPSKYKSTKVPSSSNENHHPNHVQTKKQPQTIAAETAIDWKSSAFNPSVVLKRTDVLLDQIVKPLGTQNSSKDRKKVDQQIIHTSKKPTTSKISELNEKPILSQSKGKTHQEKDDPFKIDPRRASQLAMPPPPTVPPKIKSKQTKKTKTHVVNPTTHTKALYSDVTKGAAPPLESPKTSPVSPKEPRILKPITTTHPYNAATATARRIAPLSHFNSNNTITQNRFGADNNFHMQLHSTANNTQAELTITQPKQHELSTNASMFNASSNSYSTIIFSPTKNSTALDDSQPKQYRISAAEFVKSQQLTPREQLRIFGTLDAKAELVLPGNAIYTLVRNMPPPAPATAFKSAAQPGEAKINGNHRDADKNSDTDSSKKCSANGATSSKMPTVVVRKRVRPRLRQNTVRDTDRSGKGEDRARKVVVAKRTDKNKCGHRQRISSDSDDGSDTDILDMMRGIVIQQRFLKKS